MGAESHFKISIAMATFNGDEYLQEQLDSFVCQGRLPDEVVVCDDGSTDNTLKILEAFNKASPFDVIVIKNSQNLGYTKNFEKALSLCSGQLIFLSDQDDVWFPTKIATVEQAFLENPDKLLIIHDGELVDETLVSHGATKRGQIIAGYGSDDSFITGALTAVRQDFLTYALPIPDGIVGHDGWLYNIAQLLGQRLVLHQSLQYIRRHTSNTSAWVASSVKPINRLSVAKSQFSTALANSYQDRLLYNSALIERLHLIGDLAEEKISKGLIRQWDECLHRERKAILNREELISRNFVQRKIMALRMLACGDYDHFNGLKSFMRDLIR